MASEEGESVGEDDSSDQWDDELIDGHEYDGIREYDNPIPGWLSLLFAGTIVWSLFYVVAINLGYIARYEESLERNRRELANVRRTAEANREEVTSEVLAKVVENESRLERGEEIFTGKCASCHREDGGGEIGPNLTDSYWLHGGSLKSIYETITQGVEKKGMPPWRSRLSREERVDVTAYVRSLRGTDPPDAKEPEGDEYEPDG